MNINTRYFGEMDVIPEEIITLSQGLFGFEDCTRFVLIRFDDQDDTLLSLQSMDDPTLAFVVVNPFRVLPSYEPKLAKKELRGLAVEKETELYYYAIAVVHEDFNHTTINLRCPIAINAETKQGRQIILEDGSYSMRYPVIAPTEEEPSC